MMNMIRIGRLFSGSERDGCVTEYARSNFGELHNQILNCYDLYVLK